jgi:hypothetical protein
VLFAKQIKAVLFAPVPVAIAFVVGGLIILWVERRARLGGIQVRIDDIDAITWVDALKLGLAQAAALIPGTSRSGATIIGAMMFGYMVSTIGSMVATLDKEAAIKEDRMDAVKEWMASRNIQQKLFVRVRNYYQHYYTKKSAFNEDEILASLTPSLRNECTAVLLRETLGIFPLLAVLGVDFQRAVYPHLKPVMHAHQDVIYARGEKAEDIYFLRNGTVDVLAGGFGTEVLYRINHGQHFGEEVLQTSGNRMLFDARAVHFSHLLYVHKQASHMASDCL